ncbi:ribose 5-phosphate isomerase B [Peptoniphilus koenoeneniae]|uniref:Ribose 5-phosphate isomerase B n=1 Tax=Peptoniphilus koenoeneniae TaxID=507751 RepID=A0ABU0AWF7_9FIRM|nr:ribose 5-phosphate isomerase B [Peptoniphilus koenoeneniae]MDQ0275549.1 ribose 5-phosphate isomerase B [Peptoniphilus koenoeneniae]
MKIGFGADHAGFALKEELKKYLEEKGHECIDYGTYSEQRVDYPDYGKKVAHALVEGEVEKGVLVCGSGIGISISANKVKGIRCCVCSEPYSARMSVRHNNANIIAMGGRIVGTDLAKMIVDEFFNSQFEGGRHEARVKKIEEE